MHLSNLVYTEQSEVDYLITQLYFQKSRLGLGANVGLLLGLTY